MYADQLRNVVGAGRAGSAGLAGALEGVGKLLKAVAFDGTFYHLWYLPAILLGVTLLKLLSRWVSAETVGIISVLLYLCGLLGAVSYTHLGPGIKDIDKAMEAGYSTASDHIRSLGFGAGMGLPNMKKCSDEMKIDTKIGVGTTVTLVIKLHA